MFALRIADWHQAAGHRLILQFSILAARSCGYFTNQDCTGAAIPFPATNLCSHQMLMVADKIK